MQETQEITEVWRQSAVAGISPKRLVLVTDFDGTLAEVVPDPAMSAARPDSLDALRELAALLSEVIVLSSRKPVEIEALVPIPGVRLIGDSGLGMPAHAQKEALDGFNAEAARLLQGVHGSWIEVKPASTTVHFRHTGLTGEEMLALLGAALDGSPLEMSLGRKVVEIHVPGGKGSALAALLPSLDAGGVVCFGDDENDRSLFEYVSSLDLPHMCVGAWSAEAPRDLFDRCDLVVPGPSGAVEVLQEIVRWARGF